MMFSTSNVASPRSVAGKATGAGLGVDRQVPAPRVVLSLRPAWWVAPSVVTSIVLSLGYLGICLLVLVVAGPSGWPASVEAANVSGTDLERALGFAFPLAAVYFGLAWVVLRWLERRSPREQGLARRQDGWEEFLRSVVAQAIRPVQSLVGVLRGRGGLGLGAEAYRGQVRALSRRLVEVQEVERRQIARELHDEIGQSLALLRLNLQSAMQAAGPRAVAPGMAESLTVVDRVLEQVREMSLSVRPLMLDDLGLAPALQWSAHRQLDPAGMVVRWRTDLLDRRLNAVIESECFRIAQEALTNVVRHSRATEVRMSLLVLGERLELSVADNGVGFDLARARARAVKGASLGVLSMEERALMAGGELEIRTKPGQGTVLRAWFPLRWATPQAPETMSR